MKNFIIGCTVGIVIGIAAGLLVAIAGITGFSLWWTSPIPDVTAEIPPSVALDQRFNIDILVSNPHDETVVLSNVDIPSEFFASFEVVGVRPVPADPDPLGGFGSQTWYFDMVIAPGDEIGIPGPAGPA